MKESVNFSVTDEVEKRGRSRKGYLVGSGHALLLGAKLTYRTDSYC